VFRVVNKQKRVGMEMSVSGGEGEEEGERENPMQMTAFCDPINRSLDKMSRWHLQWGLFVWATKRPESSESHSGRSCSYPKALVLLLASLPSR
jgi:hypothetical protein